MLRKAVSGIMLTLLLASMVVLMFHVQPVRAAGTIFIRPDGSVEGTDKIQRDDDVYTFTDNIYDEIVVEKDNVVIDGAGYSLDGRDVEGDDTAMDLSGRSGVTITNVKFDWWHWGIYLDSASLNNRIHGNSFVDTWASGIWLDASSNNIVSHNHIGGEYDGIVLKSADNNSIYGNDMCCYNYDIALWSSSGNSIYGNTVGCANIGINIIKSSNNDVFANTLGNNAAFDMQLGDSSNNSIYHNNFIDEYAPTVQCYGDSTDNIWDDGYPSGGNYWSDYADRYPMTVDGFHGESQDVPGSDGIWDSSYEIDVDNRDRYPLSEPWNPPKIPGDVNRDNIVNVRDLTFVSQAYGWHCEETGYIRQADLNYDDWVLMQDLVIVVSNLLRTYP